MNAQSTAGKPPNASLLYTTFDSNSWGVANHPSATFYLAPTRVWELLLGALTYMKFLPRARSNFLRQGSAWIGAAFIAFGVVTFSRETTFPGLSALAPCTGTVLIIYSGDGTKAFINRILSAKPVVFLGLISYSLYLLHWPLLAFSRSYAIWPLDWAQTGMIIALALVISVLSWKFIEQPFRRQNGVLDRRGVMRASFLLTAIAILLGTAFALSDGFPQRFAPAVRLLAQGTQDKNPDRDLCHSPKPAQIHSGELCELGNSFLDEPDFIVWGDSHADAMMPAFKSVAESSGVYGLFASHTSCPPLINIEYKNSSDSIDCKEFNDAMLSLIRQYDSVTVILIAYWQSYARLGVLVDSQTGLNGDSSHETVFARGLDRTLGLASTMNRRIWLVQQVPVVKYDPPRSLATAARRNIDRGFLQPSVRDHVKSTSGLNAVFAQASMKYSLELINPQDFMCDETRCYIEHDDRSLYRNHHHLSTFGSQFLSPGLDTIFVEFVSAE